MALTAAEKRQRHDAATLAAVRAATAAGHGEVASLILIGAIRVWRRSSGSGQWQIEDVRKIAPHSLAVVLVDDFGELAEQPEFYVVPVVVLSEIALGNLRQGGSRPKNRDSGHSAFSSGDGHLETGWLASYRDRWDFWQLWDGAAWADGPRPASQPHDG